MLDTLLMPFQFAFMLNAFGIATLVAFPSAILSCFLVLKGWALMGDAVSHATLPGIVLAWIVGLPLIAGAFAAGMVCATGIGYLSNNCRVKYDAIMGVVFAGLFGVGMLLYTAINTNVHLTHVLFGNMLGTSHKDLLTSGLLAITIVAILLLKWRDFLLYAFDPVQARASGLNTTLLHYLLLACMSLTIVATLTSVGLILAVAVMVTPGAIAFLLVRSFARMLVVAIVANLFALLAGTYLSFFIDSDSAATVVLVLSALFVVAFVHRLGATRRHSQRLNTQQRQIQPTPRLP